MIGLPNDYVGWQRLLAHPHGRMGCETPSNPATWSRGQFRTPTSSTWVRGSPMCPYRPESAPTSHEGVGHMLAWIPTLHQWMLNWLPLMFSLQVWHQGPRRSLKNAFSKIGNQPHHQKWNLLTPNNNKDLGISQSWCLDKYDTFIGTYFGRLDLLMLFESLLMWGVRVDFLLFMIQSGEILQLRSLPCSPLIIHAPISTRRIRFISEPLVSPMVCL